MALRICLFFPNKAGSHKEIRSLSAATFPVKLEVTSQFLPLQSLELRSTSSAAGCSDPTLEAAGAVPGALPQQDLAEGNSDFQLCLVKSSPLPASKEVSKWGWEKVAGKTCLGPLISSVLIARGST